MSWSFNAIGKPEAMIKALENANSGLTGQSKEEWEEAKPALLTLVKANVGGNVLVKVDANGHANFDAEHMKITGSCQCQISTFYGLLE